MKLVQKKDHTDFFMKVIILWRCFYCIFMRNNFLLNGLFRGLFSYSIFFSYVESIQYLSPFLLEGPPSVPNFERGGRSKKNECQGGLKEFLLEIFAWGDFLCFLSNKTLENEIWFWGLKFQMSVSTSFSQTTNWCLALWHFHHLNNVTMN